ncbi:M28 family peptidase [Virgibacillus sp. YIM 98842]|uniref:M28 family peptidase n=1 Tax=Virgibacillus sp. YIM 98842 TaxID=2663533 RepID=UPI0013D94BA9|nr:M28 family peptidase [Virgibacillus sp. YIM 98842]
MKKFIRISLFTALFFMIFSTAVSANTAGLPDFPDPADGKSWVLPEDMTWDDYEPIPGIDWANTDMEPEEELRGALIIVDFPDRDFILSDPKGSDPAGNPQIDPIPRDELAEWWNDFLNVPSELNNYQTIDSFWKENSYGKWGVTLDSYGVYRLDKYEFQYGLERRMNPGYLPDQYESGNLFQDAIAVAEEDMIASGEEYDFAFIVHAGYDESTVWQELGEMMFQNPEDVTDEFGPPDLPGFEDMPNWASTRYVPWTSWLAAKSIWSAASSAEINGQRIRVSIQGESDGMATFAHEFGHLQGLGDNYNNAALEPRTYSGYWETMSRGSFNGPGGTHTRYMIPATLGSSLPAPHMLRNKMKQGFLSEDEVLHLERDELKETGPVFADIVARQAPIGSEFGRTGLHGINISMDDLTPEDYLEGDWRNDMLSGGYDNYTIEVVDRIGADSFATDSGVLIAKTKDAERAPFIWVVDSHPEDINVVDFTRPDGTEAMVTKGDPRQLADALFHAGNGETLVSGDFDSVSGENIVSEYKDPYNRIHFYILDEYRDDDGVLRYRTAVRHLDEDGVFERGVEAERGEVERAEPGRVSVHNYAVTNTGEETDLIRVQAESDWETMVEHNVIEVPAGETVEVPVYVEIPEGASAPVSLTFTATSETDPDQTTTIEDAVFNDVSASGMKAFVELLDEQGAFENDRAVRALTTHLTAVEQYEDQQEIDKVIRHMESFKLLLTHQLDNGQITASAAAALQDYTDFLIAKWENVFNAGNAMDHLEYLSVDLGERVAGTDGEREAASYIEDELASLGYETAIQEFEIRGEATSQNVIATLTPEDVENPEIIHVTAHYDSVPGSPGANDNGSGTSGLLEMARALKDIDTNKEIRFVAFGSEEIGLVGARYYVEQLSDDEVDRSAANFNMDMIGTNWDPATTLYVNVVDGTPNTVWQYADAAQEKLDLDVLFLFRRGASDHVPFYNAGIDAANFIWREPGTHSLEPWYHTPEDTFDKVSQEKIQTVGEIVQTAVTDLALE